MLVHSFRFSLIIACVCSPIAHDPPIVENDPLRLLSVVNDHTVACEVRAAAEGLLVENSTRLDVLPHVFRMLPHPVGETNFGGRHKFSIVDAYMGHPGTGSAESDCAILPARAQIAYARMRLWEVYAQNAEPAEERMRVYAALFDEVTDEFQVRQLTYESRSNWTPEVRRRLLAIYEDPQWRPHTRRSVAHTIYDMQHSTLRAEFVQLRDHLISVAWSERGTEFSRLVADTLGRNGNHYHGTPKHYDPRVAVLRVDLFEHERATGFRRMFSRTLVDLIDSYLDNVSGLYRHPRDPDRLKDEMAITARSVELQAEAHETGDDAKYRKFEAELAAERQAELEERIKRIDAWIAANRDRLEKEAAEFKPRELHQLRQRNVSQNPEAPR